jgi:hypothetical protein
MSAWYPRQDPGGAPSPSSGRAVAPKQRVIAAGPASSILSIADEIADGS